MDEEMKAAEGSPSPEYLEKMAECQKQLRREKAYQTAGLIRLKARDMIADALTLLECADTIEHNW